MTECEPAAGGATTPARPANVNRCKGVCDTPGLSGIYREMTALEFVEVMQGKPVAGDAPVDWHRFVVQYKTTQPTASGRGGGVTPSESWYVKGTDVLACHALQLLWSYGTEDVQHMLGVGPEAVAALVLWSREG